ncbi:MAG: peptide chain release factor N(5)-glutamine methyltransferase [Proteobacteria bacterium]|nr:peptide chain release factor N(5)-glutamine methyltransferase [Pseudomonadota bacterium]
MSAATANTPTTVAQAIACAARRLQHTGRSEAELLLSQVLDRNRAWLLAHADDALGEGVLRRYDDLVTRRVHGEPIAYILGRCGFWSLELAITPAVLIPRPETELLVERALGVLPVDRPMRVADLGTGSGAIALALASERPLVEVFAVDASPAALAVAQTNADALGLSARVHCVLGDWCAPLVDACFDAIVSNPPYIADDDAHLQRGDLRFEPRMALASGADGLDAIRTIAAKTPAHLRDGGWLLLEHGWQQGAAVRAILAAAGFRGIATQRDLEHRERVTMGCLIDP